MGKTASQTDKAAESAFDHLDLWNRVEKTDPYFTKEFNRGGGFKGTSTSATYLVKKATKVFGPIGIGWGYDVVDEQLMEGANGQKVHKVRIKLWYDWHGKRGEVTHFGQTDFVGKNRHGMFTDEEAPKKSLTDALTKCLSMLGFAGDIHLGLHDDNKYVKSVKDEFKDADEFGKPVNENLQEESSGNQEKPDIEKIKENLRRLIDEAETPAAVAQVMDHKETKRELGLMSKDDAEDIRAYGKKRVKDLGWPSGGEKKEASQ